MIKSNTGKVLGSQTKKCDLELLHWGFLLGNSAELLPCSDIALFCVQSVPILRTHQVIIPGFWEESTGTSAVYHKKEHC